MTNYLPDTPLGHCFPGHFANLLSKWDGGMARGVVSQQLTGSPYGDSVTHTQPASRFADWGYLKIYFLVSNQNPLCEE